MIITKTRTKSNYLKAFPILLLSALALHINIHVFSTTEIIDPNDLLVPTTSPEQVPKISLVLSYCRGSIEWLTDFARGTTFHEATFVSKCGTPAKVPLGISSTKLHEISLPNVGRNDHTFAYSLSKIVKEKNYEDTEIILLLKDNLNIQANYRGRTLEEITSIASKQDFGCLQQPTLGNSRFHDTDTLLRYNVSFYAGTFKSASGELIPNNSSKFKSRYANLGSWLGSIAHHHLPTPYTEVCYGGNFAIKLSKAKMLEQDLNAIEFSLLRGDNIEEGHFAERVWAGLFSKPLSYNEQMHLKQANKTIKTKMRLGGGGELGKIKFQETGTLAHLFQ